MYCRRLFVPSRNWQQRIEDILAAIADIQGWTLDKTQEDLETNTILLRAILYSFVIIGEASIHVSQDIQDKYSEIPWRLMKDMRNVMTHEYFQIDSQILWSTIQKNLPAVKSQLESLLQRELGAN
ncbi:MAG: DUF86 domain-containing protein [Cyanosarcina radialis HA8281-LM2]|nr:DUF86 domain-containing protein [Cyanosarcina radialis HA8281-LM2]